MKKLLGKNCEVGKLIKFINDIGVFNDIYKYRGVGLGDGEWLTISEIKEALMLGK